MLAMTAHHEGRLRGFRADVAFDGDRALDGGALVLIADKVIVGVEPASAAAPAGCDVTYAPGTTLLPGLIDTHVHLCGDGTPQALDKLPELSADELTDIIATALQTQLRAGVTSVRDLGDIDWAVVDRRGNRPGEPHVMASGPPITSVGGHCANMGGAVAGRAALVAAVRERAERGVDTVKIMTSGGLMTVATDVLACQFTLDEVRLVVREAHRMGLSVTAHAHALAAVEQSVEAGVDGIEHGTCFTAEGLRTPPELAARIAAARIAVGPTLGMDHSVPVLPRIQAALQRTGTTWELRLAQAREMYDAGVLLISGSDAGITPGKRHGILPEAVVELSTIGATAAEALASATGLAADACGLADRTGRLRPGLAADLLVVDGNALADVRALRAPRTVVARGRAGSMP